MCWKLVKFPCFGGGGGGGGGGIAVVVVVDDDDEDDEEEALVDVEYWLNVVWNCCWFELVVVVVGGGAVGGGVGAGGGGEVRACWISKRVNGAFLFLTIKSTSSCFSVQVWLAIFFACKKHLKCLTFNASNCSSVVESLDINWHIRQIR